MQPAEQPRSQAAVFPFRHLPWWRNGNLKKGQTRRVSSHYAGCQRPTVDVVFSELNGALHCILYDAYDYNIRN